MSQDILTAEQVAELMGCHVETVETETRQGLLPGVKLGKPWRYPREALLRVLNDRALAEMERKTPKVRPVLVAKPAAVRPRRAVPPRLPLDGA